MKKNGSVSMITLVLCLIALFIPTYIAIGAFIAGPTQEYKEEQKKITAINIKDPDGSEYSYSDDELGKSMIELFSGMFKSAMNVTALPESAANIKPFTVKTTTESGERSYSFYFNPKGKSYYMDANSGSPYVYALSDDKCIEFYANTAAMCLFLDTPAPTLKNAFGEAISPTSIEWKYRAYNGDFRIAPTQSTADTNISYTLDGAFTLNYDIVPDYEKVILFNPDGTVAYDGLRDGIQAAVTMMNASTFKMKLEATWYEDKERSYTGSAVYEFTANVQASAQFTLGENGVEAGQIAVINAKNIQDPSLITVKFTPALKYDMKDVTVKFYGESGAYSALIPIPASCFNDNAQTGDTMKYQIDITYGDASYTLNLDVSDRTGVSSKKADAEKSDIEKYRTEEALSNFDKLLAETAGKTLNAKSWKNDTFYCYYTNGHGLYHSFGKMWELETGEKYRNEFVTYKSKEGKSVYAVNDGVVVAVGENDLLGKYIAVDHGMGLQSWYVNLGEISVAAGDSVSYKDEIAKTGITGFVEHSSIGLRMMYTVHGVPVCPYSLIDKSEGGKGLEETGLNVLAFGG